MERHLHVDRGGPDPAYALPPYSPDLNPIELMFSKLKTFLRKVAKRTVNGLIEAIGDGLRTVTPKDIHGWFHHDGYRLTQR